MIQKSGQVKMDHILTSSLTDCPLITSHLHVLKMLLPCSDGGVCFSQTSARMKERSRKVGVVRKLRNLELRLFQGGRNLLPQAMQILGAWLITGETVGVCRGHKRISISRCLPELTWNAFLTVFKTCKCPVPFAFLKSERLARFASESSSACKFGKLNEQTTRSTYIPQTVRSYIYQHVLSRPLMKLAFFYRAHVHWTTQMPWATNANGYVWWNKAFLNTVREARTYGQTFCQENYWHQSLSAHRRSSFVQIAWKKSWWLPFGI